MEPQKTRTRQIISARNAILSLQAPGRIYISRLTQGCGRSSGVEHNLAKVRVGRSNRLARSNFFADGEAKWRPSGRFFHFPAPATVGQPRGTRRRALRSAQDRHESAFEDRIFPANLKSGFGDGRSELGTAPKSFAISAGHDAAAGIARDVLLAGGNAIDAGIAATIALTVLQSEQVQLGGIAPMLIHIARENRTYAVEGVGRWPAAADHRLFTESHGGRIPRGILRSVVPAAPQAWVSALARFGTMGFADLATPATELARNGFPAHDDLVFCTTRYERLYRQYPENTKIWLPGDAPPRPGQIFVQKDLAEVLDSLICADRQAALTGDRLAGLRAVNDAFYKGDIALRMIRHVSEQGGWLSMADLAAHRTPITEATGAAAFGGRILTCGPWSQGPALAQALQILDQYQHRHTAGVWPQHHILLEALKLALADREAFYGDPDFVEVPLTRLLSPGYAASQADRIDTDAASARLPAPGRPLGLPVPPPAAVITAPGNSAAVDTSVAAIVDGEGNIFAATPSDMSFDSPAVPGLGFVISTRGGQSFVSRDHPACMQPLKRPRASACPFIFRKADGSHIAGGGPGADLQLQAALQVLAGHLLATLPLQDAIGAPRVFTQSAPTSSEPHLAFAGQVKAETGLADAVLKSLSVRGHKVETGGLDVMSIPSLCLVHAAPDGTRAAFGDPRRPGGQRQQG